MAPIDKCLAVVRTLIGQGQSNGIGIAEKAINEYVDSLPVSTRKSGLQDVQLVVETHRGSAPFAPQRAFADAVPAYIEPDCVTSDNPQRHGLASACDGDSRYRDGEKT